MHGGVATRIRILVVDIIRLKVVTLRTMAELLLIFPSHFFNHGLIVTSWRRGSTSDERIFIIFVDELDLYRFIFLIIWLLIWRVALVLDEVLHEILGIWLYLVQRESLIILRIQLLLTDCTLILLHQ